MFVTIHGQCGHILSFVETQPNIFCSSRRSPQVSRFNGHRPGVTGCWALHSIRAEAAKAVDRWGTALPHTQLTLILQFLEAREVASCAGVCNGWKIPSSENRL